MISMAARIRCGSLGSSQNGWSPACASGEVRRLNVEIGLQLFALAYNLASLLRTLALPGEVAQWSLTTLREKLVKVGARIVRRTATSCSNWPRWRR
jgi:hypothetical protein